LTEDGFGPKRVAVLGADGAPLRNRAGKIVYKLWAGDKNEFLAVRQGWIDLQNHHLALAGLDVRVDGRSYAERGIDIVPTTHVGV
ncbi:MobA/MobL family protein, partial [Stenotrophomonas maltophilia]